MKSVSISKSKTYNKYQQIYNDSIKMLDRQYIQIREIICNANFYRTATRHQKVRLELWSRKLDQIIDDLQWKKNRNNYIKLMYMMVMSQIIVEPILSLPPDGQLPFLRNYQINSIIDRAENEVNSKIMKYGYCRQCKYQKQQNEYTLTDLSFNTIVSKCQSNKYKNMKKRQQGISKKQKNKQNQIYNFITHKQFYLKNNNMNNINQNKFLSLKQIQLNKNIISSPSQIMTQDNLTIQEFNDQQNDQIQLNIKDINENILIPIINKSQTFKWKILNK